MRKCFSTFSSCVFVTSLIPYGTAITCTDVSVCNPLTEVDQYKCLFVMSDHCRLQQILRVLC